MLLGRLTSSGTPTAWPRADTSGSCPTGSRPAPKSKPIPPKASPLPSFKRDDDRRAHIWAELDAYYAKLYGLTRDELRYILDPKDVYGEDFPSETFRVLKQKEIELHGEYRTRRLVLEAWDRMSGCPNLGAVGTTSTSDSGGHL